MSDKVRVALVGAGAMANSVHYPSLAEFSDVELVALCDLIEDKLHATADRYGIDRRYTNYQKMVEDTDPDAVYVLMPPHQLFDIVVWLLKRGLHVFIEKPPGVTREQIRQMAHWAEENGCLTMVAFNRRFIPLLRYCRDKVRAEGGYVHQCVATFYKDHRAGGPYYDGAVDILTSDAIHAVDALRFMAGVQVKRVASSVRSLGRHFDTSFNALVEFENGCVGVLLSNWMTGGRVHTFEMHGFGISAFCDPDNKAVIHKDNQLCVEELTPQQVAGSEERHKYYGFWHENRHFIDCIKENQEPETCFTDAVRTMELVDAIYRNAW
ncbi:MAG: Gfo/Idh/MocA family oxidoreductase [Armatimonadetes bacterium]|nr:Gfo/Idh/MocA family oxidoreductase [Armatimonadota bacterium]